MNFVSVGDLSRVHMLRRSNAGLKSEIQRLLTEVASGSQPDVARHLDGDLMKLAAIEHRLKAAETSSRIAAEAGSTAETMQSTLATIQAAARESGKNMIAGLLLSSDQNLGSVAAVAKGRLKHVIAALNTSVAGRYVFSGIRVDSPSIVSPENLLHLAQAAIAGASNADQAAGMLKAWFDAPPGSGGFADQVYLGAKDGAVQFKIDGSVPISFSQTANDPGVRRVLMGLTIGALVSNGALGNEHEERVRLMQHGGTALIDGDTDLAVMRSAIGATQERISQSVAHADYMATELQIERSELISADSFEAGSKLIEAKKQVEALYALTARLSNLSLVRFL